MSPRDHGFRISDLEPFSARIEGVDLREVLEPGGDLGRANICFHSAYAFTERDLSGSESGCVMRGSSSRTLRAI